LWQSDRRDDLTVWLGGLRWVEGAWMQTTRLEEVVQTWEAALLDARMRAGLNKDTDNARAWRESYDTHQPYDPKRPIRVPTFALRAQVSVEFEFFLIAVRNVLRAQERLPTDLRPAITDQRLLHLTRNIAEHWDEVGGWSAEAFASEYPDRALGQISATNKEVFVSDVPLSRVVAWLSRVNRALTQAIEDADADALPPEDDASAVSGDDDLAWPLERRRERLWQVPQLDMAEWPTEDMPVEITELMLQRFRNLRELDGVE
jgi:hypothetical protein